MEQFLPWAAVSAGGLLIGLAVALWSRTKLLAARLWSTCFVTVRVEDATARALNALLWKTDFRRSRYGERRYEGTRGFVIPAGRHEYVAYESLGGGLSVFWRGWRPLFVRRPSGGPGNPDTTQDNTVVVTFVRGTYDIDSLLVAAMDFFNRTQHAGIDGGSRYTVQRLHGMRARLVAFKNTDVFGKAPATSPGSPAEAKATPGKMVPDRRLLKYRDEDLGEPRSADPFGALAYPPEVEAVAADVRRWKASEDWYKSKRIAWRRGYLLTGRPGTGKSSFVRAIAQDLDLPIHSYDLASFGNSDFETSWAATLAAAPVVALFEDLDAVFDGRRNVTATDNDPGLTLDCFLQTIGGVADASGVVVVITSNHPENLDAAIARVDADLGVASRPGRIDRIVEVGLPDAECRRRIAERILSDCPEEVAGVVARSEGMSGAQVTEVCAEIALDRYWSARDVPGTDPVPVHSESRNGQA